MRYETDMREGSRPLGEARRNPLFVAAGIVTTLLLHATIVALVIVQAMGGDEEPKKKKFEFEQVELLRLGEEKPENQLPRIANPPEPTPDQETVTLDQKDQPEEQEETEKTQQETESPPDPEADSDDSTERDKKMQEAFENLHNPNRPTNTEIPEGSPEGVAGGTIADEALASMLRTYQAKLLQALGDYWQVPKTIPESELQKLYRKARVYVRLSKQGHIVSYRFLKRTPNSQFNRSIERCLRQFQVSGGGHKLPMPSKPEVKEAVLEEGLQLRDWNNAQE